MESSIASLATQAKESTAQMVGALSKCVQEVAVHMEEQTSRVIGTMAHQLEKEIEAAAVSAAMTSEWNTRSAVDGLCEKIRAHLAQN